MNDYEKLVHYILNEDSEPEPVDDIVYWAKFMERADHRTVGRTVRGKVAVSTVFLGVDHGFGNHRKLLFETMIFGHPLYDQYQTRCSTWREAEDMHYAACILAFGRDW